MHFGLRLPKVFIITDYAMELAKHLFFTQIVTD